MTFPAAAVLVIAAGPALAQPSRPHAARSFSVHAGGGLALAAPAFTGTSTFTEYAEQGTIATRHQPGAGALVEAGIWRGMTRRFGIAVTVSRERRDAPGTFTISLPHPLYLDRHRAAAGAMPAGTRRETAVHLGLVWSAALGGLTARLGAGPSYVLAEADLADAVAHTDAYPYDAVAVTGLRTSAVRGDALGGHAAVTLERRLGGRFAASAGARWSRASVQLEAGGPTARTARVTAGGVTAAFGLRLFF